MKKLLSLALLAITLFSLVSCAGRPEDFKAAEMTITLTRKFDVSPLPGITACFHSKQIFVMIMKEPFALKEEFATMTLREYADSVRVKNFTKRPSEIVEEDGLTYFTYAYYDTNKGSTYGYFCSMYRSDDAFWLVQFATPERLTQKLHDDILTYAKSVRFTAPASQS